MPYILNVLNKGDSKLKVYSDNEINANVLTMNKKIRYRYETMSQSIYVIMGDKIRVKHDFDTNVNQETRKRPFNFSFSNEIFTVQKKCNNYIIECDSDYSTLVNINRIKKIN
ncbi:hypothetical protein A3Q56_05931 [Intoshia linei]|uniref:Uncharacterized protein n=1 Tax=Intoshia linei TaxID=1819745 RepID=A0A177AY56_9BILA|nr:hypothetical protein A3Q56_05931 [Intoshia linei]